MIIDKIVAENKTFSFLFDPESAGLNIEAVNRQNFKDNFTSSNLYQKNADILDGVTNSDLRSSNLSHRQTEAFGALADAAEKYGLTLNDTIDILTELGIVQKTVLSQDSKSQKIFSTEETLSAINDMSDGFDELNKIWGSISDTENPFDYGLLDSKKFQDTFGGLGQTYADFIKQIISSPKDLQSCKNAFNNLVTEWIRHTGILDHLDESNAKLAISMLKTMDVTNAEAFITNALADAQARAAAEKYYNAAASSALDGATAGEVTRILNETEAAGISKEQLARLALEKMTSNNTKISTSSDIDQIINLANAAGASAEVIAELTRAKAILARAENGSLDMDMDESRQAVEDAQNILDRINSHTYTAKYNLDPAEFKTPLTDPPLNPTTSYGSGSGAKNSPSEFNWMQQRVDVITSQVDKLQSKMEILVGYKPKNNTANTAIDLLIEKMSVLQQMHDTYMEKAGKIGLGQDYIDKIQSGALDIEEINGNEALVEQIRAYQDLYEKAEVAGSEIDETQKSIHELNLSKLDNINRQFEKSIDIQNQMIDTEKQLLELRQKSGESIYAEDYLSLVDKQLSLAKENVAAYNKLSAEMNRLNLQEGSDEWKEYNDQIQNYKTAILSAADAVETYKDAMTELVYKELSDFKSAMDSVNDTISTMNSLIGNADLLDDSGQLTDRGLAQVALYTQQLANAKQEAAEYANAIRSLDESLDSGLISQDEYNSMLQDYISAQNSAVEASKAARDAMIALAKEGIQAEIDAKKKLVDETLAALEAEQDLNEYQTSIAEKQDNISRLERQIAVLSNSTNRSDIAQKLELQEQLAEAQKELYDTQYDHELEQRKQTLNDEYDAYEESKQKEMDELETNLDAQNAMIEKFLNELKDNYSTVYSVLTQYGDEYSLSAVENLTSPWTSGSEAANLCVEAVGEAVANINYDIESLDTSPLWDLVAALNSIGEYGYGKLPSGSEFEDISGTGQWQRGQGDRWWYGEQYREDGNYDYVSGGIYTIDGKQYGFDNKGYMQTKWQKHNGTYYYFDNDDGYMVKSAWIGEDGAYYYLTADGSMAKNMAIKSKDGNEYWYVDENGLWDGNTLSYEEVKHRGLSVAYQRGTQNAASGWHPTDEDGPGSEIVITNDGILRQFQGGETVLSSQMTQRLHSFLSHPANFINSLNGIDMDTPDLGNIQPVRSAVEFNAPLFQIEGGLSSDLVGYVDDKCSWLQKNVGKLAYQDLKKTMLGK